jgi:hypothetical protein
MEQLGSHWKDFDETGFVSEICGENSSFIKI